MNAAELFNQLWQELEATPQASEYDAQLQALLPQIFVAIKTRQTAQLTKLLEGLKLPAVDASSPKKPNALANLTIYTDGACKGNPGPGGWGSVLLFNDQTIELAGGEALTTNNRMEILAAIGALAYVDDHQLAYKSLTVITDSQYVKNGINSWIFGWKKKQWQTANNKPVKNKDLWMVLDQLNTKLKPTWQWVKGHNGNHYNERCDALAVAEAEKQGKRKNATLF